MRRRSGGTTAAAEDRQRSPTQISPASGVRKPATREQSGGSGDRRSLDVAIRGGLSESIARSWLIDSAPRRRVLGRFSRHVVWILWATIILIAAAFYYPKAADHRSAFVRWRPQVLKFWAGVNIYDKMIFPIKPLTRNKITDSTTMATNDSIFRMLLR